MAIRLGEGPLDFVPRLRRLAGEVDPTAMIQSPQVLSDAPNLDVTVNLYSYLLLVFLCAVTLLLSGAGLYALMSFTVSQRTREIGIRTALGALPTGILVAVGRRALIQLAVGVGGERCWARAFSTPCARGTSPDPIRRSCWRSAPASCSLWVSWLAWSLRYGRYASSPPKRSARGRTVTRAPSPGPTLTLPNPRWPLRDRGLFATCPGRYLIQQEAASP